MLDIIKPSRDKAKDNNNSLMFPKKKTDRHQTR